MILVENNRCHLNRLRGEPKQLTSDSTKLLFFFSFVFLLHFSSVFRRVFVADEHDRPVYGLPLGLLMTIGVPTSSPLSLERREAL
jgi:hypothetical protein